MNRLRKQYKHVVGGMVALLLLVGFTTFLPQQSVHAADEILGNPVSCNDIPTSVIKDDSLHQVCTKENPIIGVLLIVVNFLAAGVGLVVTGGIIWGGIIYAQSNGNSQKTQQATTQIVNSVIGLLLFMFMWAVIQYVVPGGLFHS